MTEEIIIDGVDVRFCQYFNSKNKKCRTCSYVENIKYTSYKCEDDRNCYYKQLKRLEQENKELKEYKTEHKYSNAEYRQERESVIQLSYYKNKYRSALEEIRILATKNVSFENFVKIQNKINKCLGG